MDSFVIIKSTDKEVTIIRQGSKDDEYWVKVIEFESSLDNYKECLERGVSPHLKQVNGFLIFSLEKKEFRQYVVCGILNKKGYNLTALVNSVYD